VSVEDIADILDRADFHHFVHGEGNTELLLDGGHEGYLESIRVTYDPAQISYAKLVDAFFHHIDPTDPVTSDEVIEVHKRLAKFEGSIAELLQQPHSA